MKFNTEIKKQLLRSINIIKPNFHCFTFTFQMQLKRQPLLMQCPSSEALNENSYLLYCALERTIMHIDNLRSVTPFIHHHANNLSKLGISHQDVTLLCNAFLASLKIHLKDYMTPTLEQNWRQAIRIFTNIITSYLFKTSNVVSLTDYSQKQLSS
ncbi:MULTISPECIES: globin [unclassified Pseudoalteromonas]|uniref:globin n=1 Tax=unclassified Pseudoalteromonas TaxID=194690 RepID=UPI0025B3C0C2|nr:MULTISPECIES: globin [unclassified Pseudoalteromonas]MDN3378015.1 globin [Pseudoalteromonas sp. APC 3893]MDN3386781.1 globin [Pseudoalteromonas sp. APC 4017]